MKLSEIKITPLLDTLRLEDIDDATYFSEKFSNYISNSRLSLINPDQNGCPKDFFEGLSKHVKFSDSLLFGRILIVKLFHVYFVCNIFFITFTCIN